MDTERVIEAKGLEKKFGNFTAVDKIDFEVHRGEIFGFLGPNGSGKTTTIRMMLGILSPTAGSVRVLGEEIDSLNIAIRKRIGYMSQRFSLYNDLTVIQNLKFYGAAYGLENTLLRDRIKEALGMSGLTGKENFATKDLSGGWRQRLALSVAIIHRPELLFLDEPTAGVDPISRRAFWDLLYVLANDGVAIFVTTHYMDEAEHCHRLGFIQGGKIIAMGSPDEVKRNTFENDVIRLTPSNISAALRVLRESILDGNLAIEGVELYGAQIHVFTNNTQMMIPQVKKLLQQRGIDVRFINTVKPTLEDVFIANVKN